MVEIQSVAAEIRLGKKIEDDRKIEITRQEYNGPLLHRAAIINSCECHQTYHSKKYTKRHGNLYIKIASVRPSVCAAVSTQSAIAATFYSAL